MLQPTVNQFSNLQNILVVRLGAMGDIIHVMPAVKHLKTAFPSAHLTWLVEDKLEDLVKGLPEVDEVIAFPRRQWQACLKRPTRCFTMISEFQAFLGKLRKKEYDVALDFHGNFRSGLLTYLCNAKTKIGFSQGYCKEFNFVFTNVRVTPPQKKMHRVDKYLSLLRGLGIEAPYQRPSFSIPHADRLFIDNFLCNNHLDQKTIAIIHPGTSLFGKYKRWPLENYARLADRLIQESGYSVIFTWGHLEYQMAKDIVSSMRCQATIACKTSSVMQLIALLQHARLFIGGDTGPTHLASCLVVPTIAIFGPKDPLVYAPYDKNAVVVRKDIPCSPCSRRTCENVICITTITPEDVLDRVRVACTEVYAYTHTMEQSV